MTNFGLWLNPNGTGSAQNAPEPELFFSTRFYNDEGPDGSGAIHTPTGGDVQFLVFDISTPAKPFTFVVAIEDLDSGPSPAPCCTGTDNDFNDMVIEIQAFGPVNTEVTTWGAVKTLYADD